MALKLEKGKASDLAFAIISLAVSRFYRTCMYDRGFTKFGIKDVKATVSGVLEDLTFKISEGSDQN